MATAGLDPDVEKYLDSKPSSPAPTTTSATPSPAAAAPTAPTALESLDLGATAGMRTLLNFPNWISGGAIPAVPTRPDEQAQQTAAIQAHPNWYGTGQTGSEIAGGTLAALPLEAGLGVASAIPLVGRVIANPLVRGAITGATQNLLTGADNPDESIARRALTGAATGTLFGGVASGIGRAFGSGATLASQGVQDAAQAAQKAGIDVGLENLPQAGASAFAKGAQATPQQATQINSAFGKILGEPNVSDFGPGTLGGTPGSPGLTSKIGGQISAAANAGQVQLTPQIGSELTQILQDARSKAYDPTVTGKIEQEITKITDAFQNGNGVIPGSQFDTIVGAGSKLQKYAGDANDDLRGLAQRLDSTLDRGFQASSPPGTYGNWVDARTRYRILNAIEDNVEHTGGNINPSSIYADLNRRFPDLPRTTGGGPVGQAGDLANSVRTLFGGGPPGGQQAPGGLLSQVGGLGGLASMGAAGAWALHHPVPAAAAALYAGYRGMQGVGQWAQRQAWPVNWLIQRGTQPAVANALMPYAVRGGVSALPNSLPNPLSPQQ